MTKGGWQPPERGWVAYWLICPVLGHDSQPPVNGHYDTCVRCGAIRRVWTDKETTDGDSQPPA